MTTSVMALSTDKDQPIYIDSAEQHLDLKSNTVVFTGDVFMRQGSIRLRADKIVVTRPKKKAQSEIIDAYGKPASFQQTLDDGKKINGEALSLHYDVAKSHLTMQDQALLVQETGNSVKGQKISYDISKQLLMAESDKKQRVTTVLHPQTTKEKK
ncbi:MAG: lipopolysaccharide transport periplasmic protein LptA [Vibrionaceae bacterium]